MSVAEAYTILYSAALFVITVLLGVMLIRTIRASEITDRLLAINMIGTLVNAEILIMSALLKESWLIDVAMIYTMISFVSVLILARVSVPADPRRKLFRTPAGPGPEEDGGIKEGGKEAGHE